MNQGMRISDAGLDLIERWESFEPDWYLDGGGVWTIGYGTTANALPAFSKANMPGPITEERAEQLMRQSLADQYEPAVRSGVRVPLSQAQYDALVSFCYNVGVNAFRGSTLLRKLNAGDYEGAAREFARWIYDNGERVQGLANRRAAEIELFQSKPEGPAIRPLPAAPLDEVPVSSTPEKWAARSLKKVKTAAQKPERKVKWAAVWSGLGPLLLWGGQQVLDLLGVPVPPPGILETAFASVVGAFGGGYITESAPKDKGRHTEAEASSLAYTKQRHRPPTTMSAQQKLQEASTPTNQDVESKARELIDEFFDDEGDREAAERLVNEMVDKVTENRFADSAVGLLIDGLVDFYHRNAPAQ